MAGTEAPMAIADAEAPVATISKKLATKLKAELKSKQASASKRALTDAECRDRVRKLTAYANSLAPRYRSALLTDIERLGGQVAADIEEAAEDNQEAQDELDVARQGAQQLLDLGQRVVARIGHAQALMQHQEAVLRHAAEAAPDLAAHAVAAAVEVPEPAARRSPRRVSRRSVTPPVRSRSPTPHRQRAATAASSGAAAAPSGAAASTGPEASAAAEDDAAPDAASASPEACAAPAEEPPAEEQPAEEPPAKRRRHEVGLDSVVRDFALMNKRMRSDADLGDLGTTGLSKDELEKENAGFETVLACPLAKTDHHAERFVHMRRAYALALPAVQGQGEVVEQAQLLSPDHSGRATPAYGTHTRAAEHQEALKYELLNGLFWQLVRAKRDVLERQDCEYELENTRQKLAEERELRAMLNEDWRSRWWARDLMAARYKAEKNAQRDEALKKKDAAIAALQGELDKAAAQLLVAGGTSDEQLRKRWKETCSNNDELKQEVLTLTQAVRTLKEQLKAAQELLRRG